VIHINKNALQHVPDYQPMYLLRAF